LQRRGLPRTPAVLVVVAISGVLTAALAALVISQVVLLLGELPRYQHNVAAKVESLREQSNGSVLHNVQEFIQTVTAAAKEPAETVPLTGEEPVPVEVVDSSGNWALTPLMGGLPTLAQALAATGLVVVLVIYSLIFKEDIRSRLLCLIGKGHLSLTTKALDDAGRRISRYLLAQLFLNFTFGLSIGIGLLLLGVPHALLWGFCAGVLRYIPFVGPWMAAVFPVGMSLLVSDGWFQPLAAVALFVVLELLNNLVIEPWVFGQSIGVSQAAILVAVAFWAWLWGPVGLMLAAPMTVCLVVLGKYVPSLRFFDILLGDQPVLTADIVFYQRLLAHDDDEAGEIVERQSQTLEPVELLDQILIPALVYARQDSETDLLSDDDYESVRHAVHEMLHALVEDSESPASESSTDDRPARAPLRVWGVPARDAVDATALEMLALHLSREAFQLDQCTPGQLVSEVVEQVQHHTPAVVCIVALPRGGLSHTRHLCKRLRQHFPSLKLVVACWGASLTPELRAQLLTAGANYVGATLQQTGAQLEELAQFLRSDSPRGIARSVAIRADDPHVANSQVNAPKVAAQPTL
jgi:predicted PurR-regulated permease PerM